MKNILFLLTLLPLIGCSAQNTTAPLSMQKTLSALSRQDHLEPTYHIEVLKTEQNRKEDPVFKI
ncbi:MAG: hypothetical protein ACTHJ4_00935, partial [Candidatus Nucleicultricaceae bacterium]